MRRERRVRPTHPGGILRRMHMEPMGLTITELARRIGVSRKHLSNLVNEKAAVTPDMALRLARAFDTTPELWINLQKSLDLWDARHTASGWEQVERIPLSDCGDCHSYA